MSANDPNELPNQGAQMMTSRRELPMPMDFYRRLRRRLEHWAGSEQGRSHRYFDYVMAAPDLVHLLCKLVLDPGVQGSDKAKVAAALAYFVSPVDLISEALVGPLGYLDDIALAAYVLGELIQHNREAVERNWAGDQDVLALIERVLRAAENMIGTRTWKRVRDRVDHD